MLMLGVANAPIGCASGVGGSSFLASPERVLALGDWNDVDAAVEAGSHAAEMSVLTSQLSEDGRRRTYELVSIDDSHARIVATIKSSLDAVGAGDPRAGRGSAPRTGTGAVPIELSASVGRFGDADQERKLLRAVRRRIEMLSGVNSAPLPDDARDLLR